MDRSISRSIHQSIITTKEETTTMKTRTSITRRLCLALAIGFAVPAAAIAQNYPGKPVRIVVGYSPGGTTDIIARILAQRMTTTLGQPVLVENRGGASGNIGADMVSKASNDGLTLLLGTAGTMTINPSIYAKLPFDAIKDFQPISLIATLPNLMVVNPKVPAKTVQEFVAWAKGQPDNVFFASSGSGNTPHMTAELFNLATGLKMRHVPYRGSGPALTDLIGGQGVQVMFDNMPSAIGHVRNGSLRAIAVTGPKRADSEPTIPTVGESGYPDFNVVTWFGLYAPAGTPDAVVQRLNREVADAVRDPEIRKKLIDLGADPESNTPAEFAALMKADTARWAKVVKVAKIEPQ
jgi:tripartite-type tricarboxylate transporter receptor subunit TctC